MHSQMFEASRRSGTQVADGRRGGKASASIFRQDSRVRREKKIKINKGGGRFLNRCEEKLSFLHKSYLSPPPLLKKKKKKKKQKISNPKAASHHRCCHGDRVLWDPCRHLGELFLKVQSENTDAQTPALFKDTPSPGFIPFHCVEPPSAVLPSAGSARHCAVAGTRRGRITGTACRVQTEIAGGGAGRGRGRGLYQIAAVSLSVEPGVSRSAQ